MIERIAAVFGKDTVDLFALNPIRHDWKNVLLSDISKLVDQRLNELTTTESNKQTPSKK
jgi:hypothetical protein